MLSVKEWREYLKTNDTDRYQELAKKMDNYDFELLRVINRFETKIVKNDYYLSYSGGKDSHFLYWLIKEILEDDKITIVGCNTYMEHHEILQRILKNSDVVLNPELKPKEIKEKYGIPCFSKIQDDFIDRYQRGQRNKSLMERIESRSFVGRDGKTYKSSFSLNKKARELLLSKQLHRVSPKCCMYLKKKPFHKYEKETGKKAILGIRGSEGALRKAQYQTCLNKTGRFTPMFDITDEVIDEWYRRYEIEIPSVYKHICRTGCMGCPYGSYKGDTEKELALLTDAQRKFVTDYFRESYEVLGIISGKQMTIDDYE